MKNNKSSCCNPVLVGTTDTDRITLGYTLSCGEQSDVLYEAINLEQFPTVTAITEISGAEDPCTAFVVFVLGDGTIIEKEIGSFNDPTSVINGPTFTVGNVRKIFVRCKGSGTGGCSGRIAAVLSYCALNT